MRSRISAGVVAGLAAGVVFGVLMTIMTAPTPDGSRVLMMAMVAQVVGSTSIGVGWVYHLFNSAVIGGVFDWILGGRVRGIGGGLAWGALYGFIWWVLGGLILMPIFLGMPAFAPVAMAPMRPVAMGSLAGHLCFGLLLGVGFALLHREAAVLTRTQTVPGR